jgi:hypothetical protein
MIIHAGAVYSVTPWQVLIGNGRVNGGLRMASPAGNAEFALPVRDLCVPLINLSIPRLQTLLTTQQ